jgi:hypothetical protein
MFIKVRYSISKAHFLFLDNNNTIELAFQCSYVLKIPSKAWDLHVGFCKPWNSEELQCYLGSQNEVCCIKKSPLLHDVFWTSRLYIHTPAFNCLWFSSCNMEQSPHCEANTGSAVQEMFQLLRNPKCYYREDFCSHGRDTI